MKTRSILFATAILAASACAKEVPQTGQPDNLITITASHEQAPGTRSSVQDGGTQVYWEPGDNIKVFCDGASGVFASQCTSLASTADFVGSLNVLVGSGNAIVAGKEIWGLYPSRGDAVCDGSSVVTTLQDGQTGRAGSFAQNTQITLARSNSLGLSFYNVCGGLRFTLSGSGIKSIVFEGNGGESIAGKVRLSFEGGVPVVSEVLEGSSSITLYAPNGDPFKTGVWYYITALPASLNNGFRMIFRKDAVAGVLNSTSAVSIKRGVFGSIENIDKSVSYSASGASEYLPEIHDGDVVLATNPNVEKFLTEVSYPERDYTMSYILDYPPVAPGQSDLPPVYAIKWAADASAGELTARLVDGDWSQETTLAAGSTCFEVSNLRPEADYTYEVRTKGGTVMASGSFRTTGHLHQLYFPSRIRNCRDLGGWKTVDGKTVRYRKVYRGGRLQSSTLTDAGKAGVIAEGIRAQLDLRGTSDVLSSSALGTGYDFCAPVIEQGYSTMLKNDGAKVRQCFEFIVGSVRNNKPVYFHCSLGRDRTGTVAMIVLGVLGVNEGDISKEYELTQFAPNYWATSDGEHTKMTRLADYDGAALYIWNNFVSGTETFGQGVAKYLRSVGVSQTDIDDFRSIMLTD